MNFDIVKLGKLVDEIPEVFNIVRDELSAFAEFLETTE
jgi:hypothetical protein